MELFYRIIEAECNPTEAKEDLLIIHGLFGMSDNWIMLAKEFAKDRRVIIPDLRNHGQSPHSKSFTMDLLIKDILELLTKENSVSPIIIGHSLGGRIAAKLAFSYPKIVSKLIIADMNLGEIKLRPEHQSLFLLMKSYSLSNMKSIGEIDSFLKQYVHSERIRMFILKNIRKNKDGVFDWKLNFPVLMEAFDSLMPQIQDTEYYDKATLILRGGKSDYVTNEHYDFMKKHFSNIELKTIEGASHWLHADHPAEFVKIIKTFIINK